MTFGFSEMFKPRFWRQELFALCWSPHALSVLDHAWDAAIAGLGPTGVVLLRTSADLKPQVLLCSTTALFWSPHSAVLQRTDTFLEPTSAVLQPTSAVLEPPHPLFWSPQALSTSPVQEARRLPRTPKPFEALVANWPVPHGSPSRPFEVRLLPRRLKAFEALVVNWPLRF